MHLNLLEAKMSTTMNSEQGGGIAPDPRPSTPIETLRLSRRPMNCLRRAGIRTVEALVARSADELMALNNFGQTSFEEVERVLDRHGLRLGSRMEVGSGLTGGRTDTEDALGRFVSDQQWTDLREALEAMAAWALGRTGARTLGELIDLLGVDPSLWYDDLLPLAADRVRTVPLQDLAGPGAGLADWRRFLAGWMDELRSDPVVVALLDRRTLVLDKADRSSFQKVGDRCGITAEAMRRRELRVLARLEEVSADPRMALRLAEVAALVGAGVPEEALIAAGLDPSDLLDRLVLVLAARRSVPENRRSKMVVRRVLHDGAPWIVVGESESPVDLVRSCFDDLADGGSCATTDLVDAVAGTFGSAVVGDEGLDGLLLGGDRPATAEALVRSCAGFRVVGDRVVDWSGTLPEKAVRVLRSVGEPMDRDELAGIVNPGLPRGATTAFQDDDRVVRVGVRLYALAEWNLPEYENLVTHIRQALLAAPGGRMRYADLVRTLTETYSDTNENSVGMHAKGNPSFVTEGEWVRVRRSGEPVPCKPLGEEYGVVRLSRGPHAGRWAYRVEAGDDLFRGSGFQLPRSIALAFGLEPGGQGTVTGPTGELAWSWLQINAAFGSIREAVEAAGGSYGDLVFVVVLDDGRYDLLVVPADDAEDRASLLMQADLSTADALTVVARAIGLDGGASSVEVSERLEARWRRHVDNEEEAVIGPLLGVGGR